MKSQSQEFAREYGEKITTTVLPSPIVTQLLRIVPLSWFPENNSVCLKVEAFGCLLEPSIQYTQSYVHACSNNYDKVSLCSF